jgi:hypothetical protein
MPHFLTGPNTWISCGERPGLHRKRSISYIKKVQHRDSIVVQHDDKSHEHARMPSVDDRIKVTNS